MFESVEDSKSSFPYICGCRQNSTSQALSVSTQVEIKLWLHFMWLCKKIISTNDWSCIYSRISISFGALRTSPVAILNFLPSLYARREKQYAIRLAANTSHHPRKCSFPPRYVDLYEQKSKSIKSFGIIVSPLLESANIKPQNTENHFTPNIPAWCLNKHHILFDLLSGVKKSVTSLLIQNDDFRKLQTRYMDYQQVYTDGSKEDLMVDSDDISDRYCNMQHIPDGSSIFTVKAKSVDLYSISSY